MASSTTNFGASVVPSPSEETTTMLPPRTLDSPALTPAVSHDSFDKPVPPYSPFYQHPPASHERVPEGQKQTPLLQTPTKSHQVYEKDIESGMHTPLSANNDTNPFASKYNVEGNKECTMWPSRKQLEQDRLADKRRRLTGRTCGELKHKWVQCSKKEKLIAKLLLTLFLAGAAVGIAVGITKAVGGGVWSGNGESHDFGEH